MTAIFPSVHSAASHAALACALKSFAAATTQEEVLTLLAQSVERLARANGACALLRNADTYLFASAHSVAPLRLVADTTPLYQLAASASLQAHTTSAQLGSDVRLALPGQRPVALGTVVAVPLPPASDCSAVAFFWQEAIGIDTERLCTLEALALAAGLALDARLRADDVLLARARQRRLVSDLQHRVRNILAFVRSILRRTAESATSHEEFISHLEARIGALARTQGTLANTGGSGVELEDLVRTEFTANAVREQQFIVNGPAVRLRARAAETVALALHELVTNSLKYGALESAGGHVAVTWHADMTATPPLLHLAWLETGVAIATAAPHKRGFGRELIERTLPYELQAATSFRLTPGGVHCSIDLPLARDIVLSESPPADPWMEATHEPH